MLDFDGSSNDKTVCPINKAASTFFVQKFSGVAMIAPMFQRRNQKHVCPSSGHRQDTDRTQEDEGADREGQESGGQKAYAGATTAPD